MIAKCKREILELQTLLSSIPFPLVTLFALSVILMNLLANKSLTLPVDWLALDCGILVSWVSFLSMDMITRHFGPKAATEVSLVAVLLNLACCLFFALAGAIPGVWGESFVNGSEGVINQALDHTFSGTWYVLLGSTVAFVTSALVNNFLNHGLGKLLRARPQGFAAYALRSYLSTAVGQFVDNLVFALLVSHFFFGWTMLQCVTCSATGMIVELLLEALFSPIGYRICRRWEKRGVGSAYFARKGRDTCTH